MKTINKIIIAVSVLGLMSQVSLAEMKLISDEDLSNVSGQKGLTIDIDMGIEIGEFMYKDAGSIVMQGIRLGGMDRTSGGVGTLYDASVGIAVDSLDAQSGVYGGTTGLNNVRILVDVAGDGTDIGNNGTINVFNPLNPLVPTPVGIPDNFFRWAWGSEVSGAGGGATGCGNNGNCGFIAGDGDLFIHATASDFAATDDGTAVTIADFGMEMDKFALKASTYVPGDDIVDRSGSATTAQSTTIISNLRMEGYMGGFDLLLENNGNAFGEYDSLGNFTETGTGSAASKIKMNSFFKITEMEYDYDIVGIRIEKMSIHNNRGDKTMFDFLTQDTYAPSPLVATSQGFAQSNTQIFAIKDTVLNLATLSSPTGANTAGYVDGIAMNTRFRGDIDIGHMSFGDTGTSIGQQFWTDVDATTNMLISAH